MRLIFQVFTFPFLFLTHYDNGSLDLSIIGEEIKSFYENRIFITGSNFTFWIKNEYN